MQDIPITQLINEQSLNFSAEEQVNFKEVYLHLKKVARIQKIKISNGQLDTTELVNDTWLKLNQSNKNYKNRNHFFAVCALSMKHILINQSKKIQQMHHKNQLIKGDYDANELFGEAEWMIELQQQLIRLKKYSSRLEEVFTYKFFGGLTNKEMAQLFAVNERTIERDWLKAKSLIGSALER
ncbi:MAG: sigma-70 family RNA polymerase sigma factor [Xanthomonadales bacterium]|nr:sigma-70 family RNA polymerase sigma factor [Xanthomonadales bacterium]